MNIVADMQTQIAVRDAHADDLNILAEIDGYGIILYAKYDKGNGTPYFDFFEITAATIAYAEQRNERYSENARPWGRFDIEQFQFMYCLGDEKCGNENCNFSKSCNSFVPSFNSPHIRLRDMSPAAAMGKINAVQAVLAFCEEQRAQVAAKPECKDCCPAHCK